MYLLGDRNGNKNLKLFLGNLFRPQMLPFRGEYLQAKYIYIIYIDGIITEILMIKESCNLIGREHFNLRL